MIFVDSNIPMYLVGAEHPNKARAQLVLQTAVAEGERLVTDVEVLQEILHRYAAIGRLDAIQPAFDALLGVVDEVFAIEQADVDQAKNVLLGAMSFSARDALHIAVLERRGVRQVMSFDSHFDRRSGLTRVS
ncbi:PIN domain-containing protein [Gaiella occulta]|uniref:Ribonuclease VapC n=1 Tax=Gaiella occulta TaxID=1002870 RepID=A0A7M2Z2S8_9ACTN|nr:type II toxin-antitoxin system VapC family toxin [Gaiella occulta]RDI76133.1 PIN domain-containing protein [Gaiella occulta]